MIEFWFDFSSPYGFFGSLEVEDVARRHGRRVVWRPFMLGAVFKTTGMRPFTDIPLRGDYSIRDWKRIARMKGIPFALPPGHPINPVHPARLFYWLESRAPDQAVDFARLAYRAIFQEGADLREPEVAAAIATRAGADRTEALAALSAPEWKDRFRAATDEAVARQVFGSPFFIVDGEPFWGWDRLPMLDRWIASGGW
jgi:2-hydroxychromene-2-carboxylate isomerase